MAAGKFSGLLLLTNSAALQVADISVSTTVPTGGSLLQVMDVTLDVAVADAPPVLNGAVTVGGRTVVAVQAGDTVQLAVTITGAYTSTAWTVEPGSAPVQLAGGATVRTFEAPPVPGDDDQVIVRVTATGPNGTSAPYFFNVPIVATTEWYLTGSVWTPYVVDRVLS